MEKTKRWNVLYLVAILLLVIGNGYSLYKNIQLQKQLNKLRTNSLVERNSNNTSSELSFSEMLSNIKDVGSIGRAKTINTDKWDSHSDTITKADTLKLTYQSPDALYAVPSVRGFKNTLDFFENKAAYQRYKQCIVAGKTSEVDWEGACDLSEDFLFSLLISSPTANDPLTLYRPSELISYSGITDDFSWKLPKNPLRRDGEAGNKVSINAEGRTQTGNVISVQLSYQGDPSTVVEKITSLTHMDIYTLFIHILSTFRVSK